MVPFLTCKELYTSALKKGATTVEAIELVKNKQKKYKWIIKKKEVSTYIALVLADAKIDEQCAYPNAYEIRRRAQRMEEDW